MSKELGLNEEMMDVLTVDGLELYDLLEIDEDFKTWIENWIEHYKWIEGKDYVVSPEKLSFSKFKKYSLTLKVAEILECANKYKIERKLLLTYDGHPVALSEVIARETRSQHSDIMKLVKMHRADLEELGKLEDEAAAFLNERQAMFFLSCMHNNRTVLNFKKRLIKAFSEFDHIKEKRLKGKST